MNCFVASAFDHEDVDAVYDLAIRPVLKEFNIFAYRVDRVEHNDDIDNRIFQLITRSHLCIADLTYARPSVYYEAGYAFGAGKPVVYIARSDHFRARPNDEAGNLRVHLDLQMKNIIPWTEPSEAFKKRLRSRLRIVLRPLLRLIKAERSKVSNKERFAALSQNERLSNLVSKGRSLLYLHGFRNGPRSEFGPLRSYPHYAHLLKRNGDTNLDVHLLAFPGINKTDLQGVSFLWHIPTPTKKENRLVRNFQSICVIAALRASRTRSLSDFLPSWTPLAEKMYSKQMERVGEDQKHNATVFFADGIQSLEQFVQRFRPLMEKMMKD